MTKSEFIRSVGIEAYNEVLAWGRDVDDVFVYECLEAIEADYNIELFDAEDVFQQFGNCVRAVVATGDFLIDKSFN